MSKVPWVKWFAGDFLNGIADLEPSEIAVYTVILNLIYDSGAAISDDVAKIARRCNMRPTTCEKAIASLVDAGKLQRADGLISNGRAEREIESRQKVGENSSRSAKSRWEKVREKDNENSESEVTSQCDSICEGNTYQKPEARINNIRSKSASPDGFDAFWQAYPRRIGKGQARRAYATALGKIDAPRLLEATQRFAADCQGKDPKYIPHAQTWLNGERWSDEGDRSPGAPPSSPAGGFETPEDRRWMGRLVGWRNRRFWHGDWGPNPDQPDCRVPEWIRQQEKAA